MKDRVETYESQKPKLLLDFKKILQRMMGFLESHFHDIQTDLLIDEFLKEYETLIPQLPNIGGESNLNNVDLIQSTWALAIYRVLKRHVKSVEEVGEFLYKSREALILTFPKVLIRFHSWYRFTSFFKNKWRSFALETQKREYRDNFVVTFVEGDGKGFDYGYDYSECAILKFFESQGAPELVPYICATDIPVSKVLNMGLERTTTLALGGDKCDFRFKRGRETREDWPL
ncbi:MAG: L-2-amino-thiazoline-4-carboxylic acid hydrolase [Anaerolineaceae bacterium]|nr:MAG: L-2-amino-thiazoline-4-carboxylic acid hydrolase [Anaerolineaceae bacterium]